MLEDRPSLFAKGSRPQKEKTTLQRSNRVFILQYSPERSKSKKQKKWDLVDLQKEKLSSFLIHKEILNEIEPRQQDRFSHRRNIDRLTSLISGNRNSNPEGESGCEKLVKVLDKILKTGIAKAQAFEALKKYCMFCSSTNYQLFIQSKHNYLIKQSPKKSKEQIQLSPLQQIYENQNLQENSYSNENSQFSLALNRTTQANELTFRKKIEELPSLQQNQSIGYNLQSPKKYVDSFKSASRDYIPTAQTLASQQKLQLHSNNIYSVAFSQEINLSFPKRSFRIPQLNETHIQKQGSKNKKQTQFSHLSNLKPDSYQGKMIQSQISPNQVQKIVEQINKNGSKIKQNSILPSSNIPYISRNRFNFAIPTSIAPSQTRPIELKDSFTQQNQNLDIIKKTKNNFEVLNAKQIAERMLFGVSSNQPVFGKMKEKKQVQTEQIKNKKRVSSLPKITFTYSSRQKDLKLQYLSPSKNHLQPSSRQQAQLRLKSPAQNVKTIIKIGQRKIIAKQELQSTFGSTQIAANSLKSRNPHMKSPQPLQNAVKIMKISRERINYNSFSNKPNISNVRFSNNMDNEYYGVINNSSQKPFLNSDQHLRQRIISQQPYLSNDIQFVGIEEQPRGCCWSHKQNRSKSLNDRFLLGLAQKNQPSF